VSDDKITGYAYNLLGEVRAHAEAEGCDLQEAFTQLVLDQLQSEGLAEGTSAVHHREPGAAISGYAASSDGRYLDLFLSQYSERADDEYKVGRNEAVSAFKRLEGFLVGCIEERFSGPGLPRDVEDLCWSVKELFDQVEHVRLFLLTNAISVIRDPLPPASVNGRSVLREVWDLRRLAKWASSGSQAEPIVAEFPAGLTCLTTPVKNDDYQVVLAIVPAQELANLYLEHGARLLELNVRSFLQVRTAVNRGILDTLRKEPARFLAYNNGIAATASAVEFDPDTMGDTKIIRRIHNLQIVNGGQTTATISHAARREKLDISDAYVQMKLTVIQPERLDEIVPQISAFSNTQNKVTASDLKANTSFHVDVERIMRSLWAPADPPARPHETHWFYERARGQYANALAREGTTARQRTFRNINPASQKFTKSDLAKFENSWAMRPDLVSLGAEKNFTHFSERLDKNPITVDTTYCRNLIAKAILFRRTDKIVAQQKFGGYKANIVTYTVAKLVHETRGRIDLRQIWLKQDISRALENAVRDLCAQVQRTLTTLPPGRNHVGEWTKRPECWEAVKKLDWDVPPELEAELTDVDTYETLLRIVNSTDAGYWDEMAKWGKDTGHLDVVHQRTALLIARDLQEGVVPAGKDLRAAVALMDLARSKGFG
jgi:hypothetical protein